MVFLSAVATNRIGSAANTRANIRARLKSHRTDYDLLHFCSKGSNKYFKVIRYCYRVAVDSYCWIPRRTHCFRLKGGSFQDFKISHAGQNYDIQTGNESFETVEQFKYLGTTLTN
jgi:hypothetical protein